MVIDPIRAPYVQAGFWRGPLGYPTKGVETYPDGGLGQKFQGGSIFYSPGTGAHIVSDPIRAPYVQAGFWRGPLGYPVAGVETYPDGGLGQRFQGGSIFFSPATGAQVVVDPIRTTYVQAGFWRGPLGYPASGVETYPDGGLGQRFEGGSIFYSPTTGSHLVIDPIRTTYLQAGFWRGPLGYPTAGVVTASDGTLSQKFQGGTIFYSPATGARVEYDAGTPSNSSSQQPDGEGQPPAETDDANVDGTDTLEPEEPAETDETAGTDETSGAAGTDGLAVDETDGLEN